MSPTTPTSLLSAPVVPARRAADEPPADPAVRDGTAVVRLRYRPVGDVLTVSVAVPGVPGPVQRHESGPALVESCELPDGSARLCALRLLGASASRAGDHPFHPLPFRLADAVLALVDPGHRHHGHPSTHRPLRADGVRESTVVVELAALRLAPSSADRPLSGR